MPLLFGYLQGSPPWLLPWILPGLCPWTPLGAPPPNPWPAFEKAGENQLVNFFGFPAECAGPPLIGSGGLGWFEESRGWKGWWMDRLDGGKSQRSGGAAAFGRPWGPLGPTACQTKEQGPGPLAPGPALSGRFASRRRPLRYGPHQRQKGSGKARPHDLWGMARETLSERGTAPVPLLGQSPGPRSTGPGGTARPAAGYGLRPPAPAGARLSPPAQGRRARSTRGLASGREIRYTD